MTTKKKFMTIEKISYRVGYRMALIFFGIHAEHWKKSDMYKGQISYFCTSGWCFRPRWQFVSVELFNWCDRTSRDRDNRRVIRWHLSSSHLLRSETIWQEWQCCRWWSKKRSRSQSTQWTHSSLRRCSVHSLRLGHEQWSCDEVDKGSRRKDDRSWWKRIRWRFGKIALSSRSVGG